MAYEIIERLKRKNEMKLLAQQAESVEEKRKQRNKFREVREISFDCKDCRDKEFIKQKLTYIHKNRCSGKWNLCNSLDENLRSSSKLYMTGEQGIYPVRSVWEMEDVVLVKKKV